jgi:hypothetical protein
MLANSRAMMARRTAGRLGDGGGPGTRRGIFPRPRRALPGEAEVLQVGPVTAKVCEMAIGERAKPRDQPRPPDASLTWFQKPVFRPCLARRRPRKASCVSNVPKSWMPAKSDRHSRRCRAACL